MNPKHRLFDNEAFITLARLGVPSDLYQVQLRDPAGEVHTRTRHDDYNEALDEYQRLCEVAKTL